MVIKDIPREQADKLISAIAELRPKMSIKIASEDTALYLLGLSGSVLCSVIIEDTENAITDLVDEVYQMEVDAYNFSERELCEKGTREQQRQFERRYAKYAIIAEYLDN